MFAVKLYTNDADDRLLLSYRQRFERAYIQAMNEFYRSEAEQVLKDNGNALFAAFSSMVQ
jgi:hypothetical protein